MDLRWEMCVWRAVCWAVQEAARSVGEELPEESGRAKGGSRAVEMWEGAAVRVADLSKRVVSGGGVVACAVMRRVVRGGVRVGAHLSDA